MSLPPAALADVLWWEANVVGSFSPIHPPPIAATAISSIAKTCKFGKNQSCFVEKMLIQNKLSNISGTKNRKN